VRLILVSAAWGLLVGLFFTPLVIRWLRDHGYAQAIRETTDDIAFPDHGSKRGTPSMGGVVIVLGTLVGYIASHILTLTGPSASAMCVLFLMTGLAAVGFADDYIKIFRQRATGLRAKTKLIGQAVVALTFAALSLRFADANGYTPATKAVSIVRDTGFVLPFVLFLAWVYLMVAATSNGVNLTDGLDGLATGASAFVFGAYTAIGVWQFGNSCALLAARGCYQARDPLDLAVVAAGLLGVCFGFLWWNAAPAKIFMGDTGSLALGGAMAGLAVETRTELLLLVLGGLFVVITMSVIIQVASFRLTGRRVFLMAPLQHHFEFKGWEEITIVVRFWIIGGLFTGFGLAIFYAEWLGGGLLGGH
jgi:phospho-N-acetylmuramoyl-pentapeptide-transferase